jgi:hypothetical protein
MNTLDDLALVVQFIQKGTLISNQNLRVEPAFDSVQLLTKRGGLVATRKVVKGFKTVIMRRSSEYYSLVHHLLVENRYMPINLASQAEFVQYQARHLPEGYKLRCAEARLLWKDWWKGLRHGKRNTIQTDLLIHSRDTWYPVRDVACNQGVLFVTTLVSEFVFQGSDQVIWLTKGADVPNPAAEPAVPEAKKQADPFQAGSQSKAGLSSSRQAMAESEWMEQAAAPTAATPNPLPMPEDADMRPDLRQVVQFRQGKLYIATALGEVVVEGTNLKFWLNDQEYLNPSKAVDFSSYRDREFRPEAVKSTVRNLHKTDVATPKPSAEVG